MIRADNWPSFATATNYLPAAVLKISPSHPVNPFHSRHMIEGEWTILGVDYAGEPLPGRTGKLQIIGPRFALQIGGTPREVGGVEIDAQAAPATLDLIWRDSGGGEAKRLRAVVRVRGTLMQFCYFPEADAGRPAVFDSRASATTPPAILVRCRLVAPR
jgi:uncharacterized protein (TIGR03067 family)